MVFIIDPGIAAVISLAIGIATYGTGFAAIGGVKTMMGVMSQAGFTALVSKATITDYAQFAVVKAGVNTTLEMGINGTDPGSALEQNFTRLTFLPGRT